MTDERVARFAKQDRQWPRHLRIAHYKSRLALATGTDLENFWKALIRLNEG